MKSDLKYQIKKFISRAALFNEIIRIIISCINLFFSKCKNKKIQIQVEETEGENRFFEHMKSIVNQRVEDTVSTETSV